MFSVHFPTLLTIIEKIKYWRTSEVGMQVIGFRKGI